MKPLILITNDDGIRSPGLAAAAEAVEDLAELLIAAPHMQQTGMGRAFPHCPDNGIIDEKILEINGHKVKGYAVHGTPALAVAHGVLELTERKPDLCISGVNYGENMGSVLTCSGTLGAAFEAVSHEIPAIAVSLTADLSVQRSDEFRETDWSTAKKMLRLWTSRILREGMPKNVDLFNINVPACGMKPEEYRITTQSQQSSIQFVKTAPRDMKQPFALKSRILTPKEVLEKDSDIYAVYVDKITSVTPINVNMTANWRES